ncbi:MAG: DUF374 domain-containing protein [Fibrobacter sp.]|nr:DUF374 domain-containing protein [Fibrobacter sp.]
MVSSSKDGIRAASVARMWHHDIIHGSSSHGGSSALRQCLRYISNKKSIGITPDGPRGPREIVKPGVAQIAFMSKAPVIALSIKLAHLWRLNSWDRFIIPKPFARLQLIASEPILPDLGCDLDDPVERFRLKIQERLSQNDQLA